MGGTGVRKTHEQRVYKENKHNPVDLIGTKNLNYWTDTDEKILIYHYIEEAMLGLLFKSRILKIIVGPKRDRGRSFSPM